jgi:hypothetical protein
MNLPTLVSLLPMLLGLSSWGGETSQVQSLVVQDQVILRVPVRPLPAPRFEWVERKGPRCLPVSAIRGALLTGPNQIDFLLPERQRMRARFDDDCDGLDFYGKFYLKTRDQQICARRDSVHSRMGGSCPIEQFRFLVRKFKR